MADSNDRPHGNETEAADSDERRRMINDAVWENEARAAIYSMQGPFHVEENRIVDAAGVTIATAVDGEHATVLAASHDMFMTLKSIRDWLDNRHEKGPDPETMRTKLHHVIETVEKAAIVAQPNPLASPRDTVEVHPALVTEGHARLVGGDVTDEQPVTAPGSHRPD